jgi:hypothetical protein
MVASGALHASALSLLRKHLTTENAAELFELCKRKSARKVEELLAARFPRPDVRDLVRRLPAQVASTPDVGCGSEEVPTAASPRESTAAQQEVSVECRSSEPSAAQGHTPGAGEAEAYVSPDGRRCSARRCLELDHVDPWAVGGGRREHG